MPYFRKKPVIVEARQMPLGPGNNVEAFDIYKWVEESSLGSFDYEKRNKVVENTKWIKTACAVSIDPEDGCMVILTLEGLMKVKPGDWVIKGVGGEFYPCKPDLFEKLYDTENPVSFNDKWEDN